MLAYQKYIKTTQAYKNALVDFEKERLAHTYLLENKDMDLCFEFAKILATLIIRGKNPDDVFIGKLEKNIHPDVKVYGLEKKIMVENATEIVSDVFVMPYEENRKVYILLDAGSMTNESQNKLLKTLEEPPTSSYFILCTNSEKSLLQTIISRSKKIEIEDPSADTISSMLVEAGVEKNIAEAVSVSASGDVSKAMKMAENSGFIKLYNSVFEMFGKMNTSRDVLMFTKKFSGRDFDASEFLSVVEVVARDVIYVLAKTENLVLNKHRLGELKLIASGFTISALTKILKECFDFRESLYYNVSITPALDEFLLKFVEVKVKCKK